MQLKDISIFFTPKCNNTEVININKQSTVGRVSSLGETLPKKRHQQIEQLFSKYKHLPLQEICVTFTTKWRKQNILLLHNNFRNYVDKHFKKHKDKRPLYCFYPEFSPKGYLHYHGIIYFDNANDYWTNETKRLIRNRYGNTEGKQIYNFTNYFTYMTKDKEKDIGNLQSFYGDHLTNG